VPPTDRDNAPAGKSEGVERKQLGVIMPDTTQTLADLLHAAGDLLAEHPDLPQPYITTSTEPRVDLNWYLMLGVTDLGEQKATAQQIIRAVGGHWTKIPDTYSDFMFRQDRDGLRFEVMVTREAVCERVVTGTETVTVPAVAAQPARTEEREVVEWRCEPLLAQAVSA
jgi:hypothetical protein